MDNGDRSPLQQTKCNKTLLSVTVTVILNRYDIAIKHGWNIGEIYSVLTKINKAFCFFCELSSQDGRTSSREVLILHNYLL